MKAKMLAKVKGMFLTRIALNCVRLNMALPIILGTMLGMKSANLNNCNNVVHKPVNIRTKECFDKSYSKILECWLEGWWSFIHLKMFSILNFIQSKTRKLL